MLNMTCVLTFERGASGMDVWKWHSLMYRCLTHLPDPPSEPPFPSCTYVKKQKKSRKYENRLLAENCCFTPLIFSTSGECSPLTARFLKKVASKMSEQKVASYNQALCWLQTKLSFSLARAASMCLRSYRRKFNVARTNKEIEPATALMQCRGPAVTLSNI